MRIIVTGGAGFIGSALVHHLISERGISVVNVDLMTYAASRASLADIENSPLYRFEKADIRDAQALAAIFTKYQPDGVMHLAAESHVDRSITGSRIFLDTNIMGTATLLECVRLYLDQCAAEKRDAFRMVHVSTDEVYGSLGNEGLFVEDTPYDPSSPYSASKAASDHLVMAWARTYGLPLIISNCSNNYGPRQFPEKLIPLMILNCIAGLDLPVYGAGSNIRDWLHVEDHARALTLILEKGVISQKYNIGGLNERSNLEVVNAIAAFLDRLRPGKTPYSENIRFVADRPGHDLRYAIDASKIGRELGWRALETFETGLEKTIQWYLDHPAWWRPLREKIYSGERMGLLTKV